MLISVDPRSTVPLTGQIAASIRKSIAASTLSPGDRLPPARQLAKDLGVNMHTVLKAYQQLQEDGLLEVRRGRGVSVVGTASAATAALHNAIEDVVRLAHSSGLSRDELTDLLRKTW